MQGKVKGGQRRRQCKIWHEDVKDWTGITLLHLLLTAANRTTQRSSVSSASTTYSTILEIHVDKNEFHLSLNSYRWHKIGQTIFSLPCLFSFLLCPSLSRFLFYTFLSRLLLLLLPCLSLFVSSSFRLFTFFAPMFNAQKANSFAIERAGSFVLYWENFLVETLKVSWTK